MKFVGTVNAIYEKLKELFDDREYIVEIRERKNKRSIDQNNYYWELLDKYANYENISKEELHRRMIAEYGQRIENLAVPTPIDYDYTKEREHIYLRPTHTYFTDDNGKKWQWHFICKGSSEYDTKEMSILIDGLINDIEGSEAPIDTMSIYEREKLWGLWEI